MNNTIEHFMWGWQEVFRSHLEYAFNKTLAKIATGLKASVFLVGVRRNGKQAYPVCVEPEGGPIPHEPFDGLEVDIEDLIRTHPMKGMHYGDERANRLHPVWIRADAIRQAIQKRLDAYDADHGTVSFVGGPSPIDGGNGLGHDVSPVFRFERSAFDRLPRLNAKTIREHWGVSRSLQDEVLSIFSRHAGLAMSVGEPGGPHSYDYPSPDEVLRQAGSRMMSTPGLNTNNLDAMWGAYEYCNLIASLRYEGGIAIGRLVIARPAHPAVTPAFEFASPVPMNESKWARKVLEMASDDLCVLSDGIVMTGLGRLNGSYDPAAEDLFVVEFHGPHVWDLTHHGQVLMRVAFGIAGMPRPRLDKAWFCQNYLRVFRATAPEDANAVWRVVEGAMEQKHGAMVVVSEEAADEAARLSAQAMPIKPIPLDAAATRRASSIDGTILLDAHGSCHAIGVILDGMATDECTPSRGSRYNSAVRYVGTATQKALAVVVSEDGDVDVLPHLPPLLARQELQGRLDKARDQVSFAESADESACHHLLVWLDKHRLYLDEDACENANRLRAVFDALPREPMRIRLVFPPFNRSEDFDPANLS